MLLAPLAHDRMAAMQIISPCFRPAGSAPAERGATTDHEVLSGARTPEDERVLPGAR